MDFTKVARIGGQYGLTVNETGGGDEGIEVTNTFTATKQSSANLAKGLAYFLGDFKDWKVSNERFQHSFVFVGLGRLIHANIHLRKNNTRHKDRLAIFGEPSHRLICDIATLIAARASEIDQNGCIQTRHDQLRLRDRLSLFLTCSSIARVASGLNDKRLVRLRQASTLKLGLTTRFTVSLRDSPGARADSSRAMASLSS